MSSNYVTEKGSIGSGAFSIVYKGYNKNSPDVTLAVKVLNLKGLLQQYGNPYRKYLQREIDAMKMLRNHPNIVCLNDVEYLGDYVYIGMEYCESDLKQYLHDKKTNKDRLLSEEEAQIFMRQIANGLKFMGGQAIAHRDLKPQNILMSSNDGHAILKIADFGFARTMAKDSMNMNASHCGTPLYMAPEVQKQVYSDTCDLWSLGIILFEMMFGFTKLRHCKHIIDVGGISPLLPKTLSPNCTKLFEDLLQVDPAKRIPWIDFFNHPFLYEPHPEVSLLKPAEPNTVQVFSFPSLQAFSLVLLDEDETINQWKIASGLDENCIAILCRDTETNRPDEISKWSGVEMRNYESIGVYQFGSMGTSNQCIFIFDNQEAASAKLLLDASLRAGPKIEKPSVEDPELYLKQCRDAVSALYEDLVYVYEACSKYVLTRELLRYGNRAIRAASKTRREDLEVEHQKLGNLLEPAEADWKRATATYTERKSAIEMFPAIALPAFLRPTKSSVDDLVATKQNEIDAIKAQLVKINTAFGKAKAAMNSWRPSTLLNFIEGEYKELLNGKMYEFKRNVSHFLSMLETTKVTPQTEVERAGGKVEEPIEIVKSRILLEYSLDLNRRVREFYERLLTTFQDTDELIDQTKKAVDYHKLLTRMQGDDVDMSVAESLPSLTREALAFKNAVQPICSYVDLPSVVNQFVRLLHARQKYERQIRNLKMKADLMLTNLYARHQDNLENFFKKHEQQLSVLFPNFTQISALPLSSVAIFPLPSLCDYSDIPPFSSISSPIQDGSEFDLEDEFSMIVKEGTTISSLLHDTARLANQLREVEREKERQNKKEEENSGELTRRVRLYERMITLKNEQGGKEMANENQALREQLKLTTEDLVNTTKELEEAQKQKSPPRDANYDFELRAKLRGEWEKEVQEREQTRKTEKEGAEELIQAMNHTIDQLTRENGEQKTMLAVEMAKLEEERDRVEGERENLQNAQKRVHEEDKELRAQLEAMRKQLATAQENANAAQELRTQNDAMRTQLSAAQSDVQIAHERLAALELQQAELRDEVMAYKLAYAMDGIALPVPLRPNLE